jgi:hypothetical protein
MRHVLVQLRTFCEARGLDVPARSTVYAAMARAPGHSYAISRLPDRVRETLHNVGNEGDVPGHQLAFHCLNYGGVAAASFAAGLPWLDLYRAGLLPGWRPRSRGLLEAILKVRRI